MQIKNNIFNLLLTIQTII